MSQSQIFRHRHADQAAWCSACGGEMRPFFELPGVPVNSCLLVGSYEEARTFPRGDIVLSVCHGCGFIRNTAFDPKLTEYSGRYEETQGFSATFNRFHQSLAEDLVTRHRLRDRTIVEVGCGKGEFLALLCRLGGNRGVGYDPSFDDHRGTFEDGLDVRVVREFFARGSGTGDGDLVCCKMTLEHIPEAQDFVLALRGALRSDPGSTVFIQVPESLRILRDCAFEDVYYEHCSYFTPGSLARLVRRCGLRVDRIDVTYGSQYLTLEGGLDDGEDAPAGLLATEEPVDSVIALAEDFRVRFENRTAGWRGLIQDAVRRGPVALWGSGSKAVAFLRATAPESERIEHVVDINPHRHGYFMPGTGQRILSPAQLADVAPRTVIAMNAIYREEIAADLSRLGIDATLLTL